MEYKNLVDLFFSQVEVLGDRIALKRKVADKWEPISWKEWGGSVERVASGLRALGLERGERVCILSRNRVEWVESDLGIMSAGAATVGIYASNLPSEVAYVTGHSEAPYLFVEDEEQLNKVIEVRSQLPDLRKIIVFDMPAGAEGPDIISYDELVALGDENIRDGRALAREMRENLKPSDMALIVYTSGTTGPPKGAMLSHHNLLWTAATSANQMNLTPDDESLSFLPLAHLLEHYVFFSTIVIGGTINFAESIDKLSQNLGEVRPTILIGVPRVYEKIYSRIQTMAESKGPVQARIFRMANKAAREYAYKHSRKQRIGPGLRIRHAAADALVFRKLRGIVGGRIKFLGSGGAPLAAEIAEFFYGAGLPIIEAYGMTETTAPATMTYPGCIKPGTVGKPLPGVDVKIAEDGEILVRGPNVFMGYFKNPQATAESLVDGWMYTGDVGKFDEDGLLVITDRKKDLIITAGGKNIAPQNIENLVKTDSLFSQVVIIGDRRPYCVALITLNEEEVKRIAEEEGLSGKPYNEMIGAPAIMKRAEAAIAGKNSHLARYEQIKKFKILDHDFSQATGELTPTLKVKRKIVNQKYKNLIDEMYE